MFDFYKKRNNHKPINLVYDFETFDNLDDIIDRYNKENDMEKDWELYQEAYEIILSLEQEGKIALKNMNKNEIGVCVRGRPLLKKRG